MDYDTEPWRRMLGQGDLPECGQRAQQTAEVIVIEDLGNKCRNCPLLPQAPLNMGVLAARLAHEAHHYGVMSVSLPAALVRDEEELALFSELAADIGLGLYKLDEAAEMVGQVVEQGRALFEMEHLAKDGRLIPVEVNAIRFDFREQPAILSIVRDVTERLQARAERERLQTQLLQAQKMEALGTLAGGIAHDFNNILMAILGYTDMALEFLTLEPQGRQFLEEVRKASYRAKELVEQILIFSRKREGESRPLELRSIVKETLKLLRASLPSTIDLQLGLARKGAVVANPTQMHQVLMNLCTNVFQAMPRGGVLTVALEDVELPAGFHKDLAPGVYVKLEVTDTGEGMTPVVQARIFEPYFTTKEIGRGTGMGLAVVSGIVKQHGGTITVQSEPGGGSSFSVFLPRTEKEAALPKPAAALASAQGSGCILLVDDEEPMALYIREALGMMGYEVVAVTSSLAALEIFRAEPGRFHLVLSDLTMPKLTGLDLAQEILALRPDIPILLATGYSDRFTREDLRKLGIRDLILKPIGIGDLAEKVRTILGKRQGE